jgi:hypothetical protein
VLIAHANWAGDQLALLSPEERDIFFAMHLHRSNVQCGSSVHTFYQGTSRNMSFWNILCRDGASYVVIIHPDAIGSTRIFECSRLKAELTRMHIRFDCFKKF